MADALQFRGKWAPLVAEPCQAPKQLEGHLEAFELDAEILSEKLRYSELPAAANLIWSAWLKNLCESHAVLSHRITLVKRDECPLVLALHKAVQVRAQLDSLPRQTA